MSRDAMWLHLVVNAVGLPIWLVGPYPVGCVVNVFCAGWFASALVNTAAGR